MMQRHSNSNLSSTFKKLSATVCHEKEVVDLTLDTFKSLQSDEIFDLIWEKLLKDANTLQLTEASSPRNRKRPTKTFSGNETSVYDDVCEVKTFCRYIYFNVIDFNCIEDRFAQTGYQATR